MKASTNVACTICCDLGIINLGPSGLDLCFAIGCAAKNKIAEQIRYRSKYLDALEKAVNAANDTVDDINSHHFYATSNMIEAALSAWYKANEIPFIIPIDPMKKTQ